MRDVLARIDEWERSGLIDAEAAGRLRSAEAGRDDETQAPSAPAASERSRGTALASVFGPGVSVGEMFAYLGAGFLLAAWSAFVARDAGDSSSSLRVGVGFAIAAIALAILGVALRTRDARRRRAAGVAFFVATGFAAAATAGIVARWSLAATLATTIVTIVAVLVAAAFRRLQPALLTEFGLISAVTGLGGAVMAFVEDAVTPQWDGFNSESIATFDHLPLVLAQAAGWLLIALVLGLYALVVARSADEDDDGEGAAAHRRATLVRGWAGLVAVLGLTTALTKQAYVGEDYQRVVPVWAADVAILLLAIVLVERAFRRDSGAFLFAAGIGFIAALTDFNFSYLTSSTEVGLLVEGVILLAVGFVADRLRRRLSAGPAAVADAAPL